MNTSLARLVAVLILAFLVVSPAFAETPSEQPQGWLGVLLGGMQEPQEGAAAPQSVPMQRGVVVRGVVEGSPADRARLRAKDAIVAVDGASIQAPQELLARLRSLEPGTSVTLSVLRGTRELDLAAAVGTRPTGMEGMRLIRGWLGVEAIELPPSLREHFGAPEKAGILISKVVEGSPAEESGIRIGDVVYEADGTPVTSLAMLGKIVTEAGVENALEVTLARDGAKIVVEPRVARAPEDPPR